MTPIKATTRRHQEFVPMAFRPLYPFGDAPSRLGPLREPPCHRRSFAAKSVSRLLAHTLHSDIHQLGTDAALW